MEYILNILEKYRHSIGTFLSVDFRYLTSRIFGMKQVQSGRPYDHSEGYLIFWIPSNNRDTGNPNFPRSPVNHHTGLHDMFHSISCVSHQTFQQVNQKPFFSFFEGLKNILVLSPLPSTPTPQGKHYHSFLPHPRACKFIENAPIGLLNKTKTNGNPNRNPESIYQLLLNQC